MWFTLRSPLRPKTDTVSSPRPPGGRDYDDAVDVALLASGVVVQKVGTATASPDEMVEAEIVGRVAPAEAKIATPDRMVREAARWRERGLKVGFTNGCFDILHRGHIVYLSQASEWCDRLIVGLNTDRSVKALKGEGRPVNDLERSQDPEGVWRAYANTALAGPYQTLFAELGLLVLFKVPSFDVVLGWREEQEAKLRDQGQGGMTKARFRHGDRRRQPQASARARRKAASRALRVSLAAASNWRRASASRPARNRKSPLAAGSGA